MNLSDPSFSGRFCRWLAVMLWLGAAVPALAQPAYEASWKAGLFAMRQNPAAIAAASHRGEIMFGGLDLTARNSLFETNSLGQFWPPSLLGNLLAAPANQRFLSGVDDQVYFSTQAESWSASQRNYFHLPGAFWRLKGKPDLVERGIARQVISLRLEREELVRLQGVPKALAQGYQRRFDPATTAGQGFEAEEVSFRLQSWNALAATYGISLGRGNKLWHLGLGARLLSVDAFLDWRMVGARFDFGPDANLNLSVDSLYVAYNPSAEQALGPEANDLRRLHRFENSWGVALDAGLIYQVIGYDRTPKFEVGASVQSLGCIQFWNLKHTRSRLEAGAVPYSFFDDRTQGPAALAGLLQELAVDTSTLAEGITERLPLLLTAHSKFRLGKRGLGLQLRGNFRRLSPVSPWETLLRVTLCYEKDKLRVFVPLASTLTLPAPENLQLRPRLGIYLALGDVLVIGSDDLLTNLFFASTREGVAGSHFFAGFHVPINPKL